MHRFDCVVRINLLHCGNVLSLVFSCRVQMMMGGFGGAYKKAPTTKSTGKAQELVVKGNGLEQCDKFWTDIFELFADSPFVLPSSQGSNLEKYMQNVLAETWLTGLDSQAHFVACPPNGLGCFRLLVSGEVTWALFELRQLSAALKQMGLPDQLGLDELYSNLKACDEKVVADLYKHGCTAKFAVQKSGSLLYIPTGWVAAECVSNGLLVYGLRKTLLYPSPRAGESYEIYIGMSTKAGKPVDKMQTTLSLIAPAEA